MSTPYYQEITEGNINKSNYKIVVVE